MHSTTIASRTRRALPLLTIALLAALGACGSDSVLDVAHSWSLRTIDGSSLPFTVPNAEHDIVIFSAIANLDGGGDYTVTFGGTMDGVAGVVATDEGTWTIRGSTINFTSSTLGGTPYLAPLDGGTYRASVPGRVVHSSSPSFEMVFAETG